MGEHTPQWQYTSKLLISKHQQGLLLDLRTCMRSRAQQRPLRHHTQKAHTTTASVSATLAVLTRVATSPSFLKALLEMTMALVTLADGANQATDLPRPILPLRTATVMKIRLIWPRLLDC